MTVKKTKKKSRGSAPDRRHTNSDRSQKPGSGGGARQGPPGKKSAKKKKGAIRSVRAETGSVPAQRGGPTAQRRGPKAQHADQEERGASTRANPSPRQPSLRQAGPQDKKTDAEPMTRAAAQVSSHQASKSAQARARRASAKKDPSESPTMGTPPKRRAATATPPGPAPIQEMSNDDQQSEPPAEGSPSLPDESTEILPIGGVDVNMLGIGSPLFVPGESALDEGTEDWNPENDWTDDVSVETRIREIQERLDGLMGPEPSSSLDPVRPPAPQEPSESAKESAVTSAREVLESEYYRKNWGRGAIRQRTFDVDDFGLDPDFERKVRPAVDFLFKRYFRVEVEGVRHVPDHGRGVVVANHSGALPFDGVMLRHAITTRHSSRDDLRWLAEDFSFYLPFLGVAVNRMGAVRACPENATRLLEREHLVGVFPEGVQGMKKLYKDRYRLRRFGRGGFVRLALQTQSPIIPCAIVGAEETHPILFRFDNLSTILGLDYLPITPTFPWLGPLGLIPAPTKWRILFGEPMSVEEYGPEAAQDHVLVGRLTEQVRQTISGMLQTALRRRRSIWLG